MSQRRRKASIPPVICAACGEGSVGPAGAPEPTVQTRVQTRPRLDASGARSCIIEWIANATPYDVRFDYEVRVVDSTQKIRGVFSDTVTATREQTMPAPVRVDWEVFAGNWAKSGRITVQPC